MIRNKYSTVIVGKNYLSLIWGLINLRSGKDVIIIDDERLSLDGSWVENFSPFELKFFNLFGEHFKIESLKDFSSYVFPTNLFYFFNNRFITLGNSYSGNLKELCRKFPEIFHENILDNIQPTNSEKNFDDFFNSQINQAVEDIFKYHNFQDFDQKFISFSWGKLVNELFDKISFGLENWNNVKSQLLCRQFVFTQQIFNQPFFTDTYSTFDLKSIIFTAISPKYKLSNFSILKSLEDEFKSAGGHIRKVNIKEWYKSENQITSLLLDSYEGVLNFEKLYLFGNIDEKFPFRVDSGEYRLFSTLKLNVKYPENIFEQFNNYHLIHSSLDKLGTDFPVWRGFVNSPQTMEISYMHPLRQAGKSDFYYKSVLKNIFDDLEKIFPSIELEKFKFSTQLTDTSEVFMEKFENMGNFVEKIIHNSPNRRKFKIKDLETGHTINGIDYWGAQRVRPSGLFSYLMELKNTSNLFKY